MPADRNSMITPNGCPQRMSLHAGDQVLCDATVVVRSDQPMFVTPATADGTPTGAPVQQAGPYTVPALSTVAPARGTAWVSFSTS